MINAKAIFKTHTSVISSVTALAGSGVITIILSMIGGIVQARYIDPETLGYFAKFGVVSGYLAFLHLGIFDSLQREYPYLVGKGDPDRARAMVSSAYGWTALICGVCVMGFAVPVVLALVAGDPRAAVAWAAVLLQLLVLFYTNFLGTTFRNADAFTRWSKSLVVTGVTSFLFLGFVAAFKFYGMCIRVALAPLVGLAYAHKHRPVKVPPRFDWAFIKPMIAFGFPVMVFAYIAANFSESTVRVFILRYADEHALGLYMFATTIYLALQGIALSFQQVFSPRIAMRFGQREDFKDCYRYTMKCTLVSVTVMLGIVALAYFLIDPFVRYAAPKYVDAIPVVRVLMWMVLSLSLVLPRQLLIIAKRTWGYGVGVVAGFLGMLVALLLLPEGSRSLQNVLLAFIGGKFVTSVVVNLIVWREAARAGAVPMDCDAAPDVPREV